MNKGKERTHIRMSQKFTKIVATVGPASTSREVLEGMIKEGVNVIRLNFSHGEYETHATTVERVKAIDQDLGTHTALLADMQGPKLRVGMMEDGAELVAGAKIVIRVGEETGNAQTAWTRYEKFAEDVQAGEPVLLDDGKLRLRVEETNGKDARDLRGGTRGDFEVQKGLEFAFNQNQLAELDHQGL